MRINMLAGLALFGCASLAGAQATTQTTTTQTETKVVTVDGEVVRYEPFRRTSRSVAGSRSTRSPRPAAPRSW